jgi:hypothetical protein
MGRMSSFFLRSKPPFDRILYAIYRQAGVLFSKRRWDAARVDNAKAYLTRCFLQLRRKL